MYFQPGKGIAVVIKPRSIAISKIDPTAVKIEPRFVNVVLLVFRHSHLGAKGGVAV